MPKSMLDFKPFRDSGYTGRHDDKPERLTAGQVGVLSFVAGMMFAITLAIMWGNA